MESSAAAVVTSDLDGVIVGWSAGAEQLLGYTAAEMLGQPIRRIVPDDLFTEECKLLRRCADGAPPPPFLAARITRDGAHLTVTVSLSAVRNTRGEVIAVAEVIEELREPGVRPLRPGPRDHRLRREFYECLRTSPAVAAFVGFDALDGLWFRDLETPDEEWLSPRLKEILGYAEDEAPNSTAWRLGRIFDADVRLVVDAFERHCADRDQPYDVTVRYRHKDGSTVWIRCRALALRDPSGRVVRMLGTHSDVSAIKRAEERVRAMHEAVADMELSATLDGTVTECNHTLTDLLGREREEILGRPLAALCHPRSAARVEAVLRSLRRSGTARGAELALLHRDGGVVSVLLNAETSAEPGREELVHARCRDISHLKRVANVEVLLEALSMGALLVDDRQRITTLNEAAGQTLGYEREELIGRPVGPLFAAPDPFATGGRPVSTVQTEAHRKDGTSFAAQVGVSSIHTREGTFTIVTIVHDTELRRAEASLLVNEERLRLAQEGASQGVWDWHVASERLELSPELERMYGLEAGSFSGRAEDWVKLVHPDDLARILDQIERAIVAHTTIETEFRVLHPTGVRWMASKGRALYDPTGTPLRILGVNVDVTERKLAEEALRTSERRFREVAECLPQLTWVTDPTGAIEFVSKRAFEYTGLTPETREAVGGAVLHPDDHETFREVWRHGFKTGLAHQREVRLRRHDGVYRWFDARMVPLHDVDGRIVRWFGAATDVHEAHEMREALRRDEECLRKVAETSPGVLCTYRRTPEGIDTFPYTSPRIKDLIGFGPEELVHDARFIWDYVHPDDVGPMRESVAEAIAAVTPWRYEFRVRNPLRGELWIEGHSVPDVEPDGGVLWYGFLNDVTERKRMEEALRESEARFRSYVEEAPMALLVFDRRGRCVDANRAAAEMLGYDLAALLATSIDRLLLSEDLPRLRADAVALESAGRIEGEYRAIRKDGILIWVSLRCVRLGPDRFMAFWLDVTAQKRMEEAQLRSQKLEALGTLAGGIAHDFNNVLLAINGNAALASMELPAGHPVREHVDEISKAGARATDLVRNILTFGRPQASQRAAHDIRPLVDDALKLVRATLPARIALHVHFARELPQVMVDPTQVHQVVVNLSTNAGHAIGERSGHIEFRLVTYDLAADAVAPSPGLRPGRYVRLTVRDDGCGMDHTTMERIFDPFFTTKAAGEGSGLGLSVVHGIMKGYDGAVTASSRRGAGTAFDLYFPAIAGAGDVPVVLLQRDPVRSHGERILYVDDEEAIVQLATRVLERLGYAVTGHTCPETALADFGARPFDFDVVVTDLSMPQMSGLELARAVRAARPGLPIVMTSGYLRPGDEETARALDIDDLILKPHAVEELGDVLDRLVRRPARAGDAHAG